MIAMSPPAGQVYRHVLEAFFQKYPNKQLRSASFRALADVLALGTKMPGSPAGWAAGIVFAVGSHGCGVPGILNRDLEEAFGVKMATVYKRSWQIRRWLGMAD